MMTKAYLESAIERHGEKAEIIIFARDALAYLDRSETAEAERDALAERINLLRADLDKVDGLRDDLSKSRAFARGLSANIVAAEEARDLAIVERDEAYKQRDAMRSQINDARAILGAAAGDLLSDAAERAACAVQHEANAMDIIGRTLGRKVVGGADVAAIHASEEIDRLRERVAELESAEAEPAQVFRPPISVTVSNAGGMVFAEIAVGDITDPAFIALSGHQLSRLGLVVRDE